MSNKISDYIQKQKSPQKEICQKLRKLFLKTLPRAKEEMKWGVPTFSGGKFYIGAFKNRVHIGFAVNGLNKKEKDLFEGGGRTMRHLKINSLKDIDEKKLARLIKMVDKKTVCESC